MNILLKDCQEVIDAITLMRADTRIGNGRGNTPKATSLTRYREISASIISQSLEQDYLTEKQVEYLKSMLLEYHHIQNINAHYETGFREEAYSFLESIITSAETRAKELPIDQVRARAEQIRDNEYVCGVHFDSAQKLIVALRKKGVKTETLERKLSQFKRKSAGV